MMMDSSIDDDDDDDDDCVSMISTYKVFYLPTYLSTTIY